jgi:hypothetical protein
MLLSPILLRSLLLIKARTCAGKLDLHRPFTYIKRSIYVHSPHLSTRKLHSPSILPASSPSAAPKTRQPHVPVRNRRTESSGISPSCPRGAAPPPPRMPARVRCTWCSYSSAVGYIDCLPSPCPNLDSSSRRFPSLPPKFRRRSKVSSCSPIPSAAHSSPSARYLMIADPRSLPSSLIVVLRNLLSPMVMWRRSVKRNLDVKKRRGIGSRGGC